MDLDDEESVNIDITSDKNDPVISNMLKFSFSELDYALLDEDSNEILTAKYGEKIRFNDLDISIQSASLKEYRPLEIRFRNPQSMYNSFKAKMNVS